MKRHITFVIGALLLAGLAGCSSDADSGVATAGGDTSAGTAAPLSNKESALKFAQCMRENGVPDFQDPKFDENGEIEDMSLPKSVKAETAQAAQEKCQQHLPHGGAPEQNGVPKFPDPDSNGRLQVDGIDTGSADYKAANEKCQHLMPGGGGFQPGQK
jgi:TolA-binding protein